MHADDFAKIVRTGNGRLRVDNVILFADGQDINGRGLLVISDKELVLQLTLSATNSAPPVASGVWNENDYWRVKGVIEDDIEFFCGRVSPGARTESSNPLRSKTVQDLRLHPIELISRGSDAWTTSETHAALGIASKRKRSHPTVKFRAILVGVEPHFLNAGSEVIRRNDFLGKRWSSSADTFIDRSDDYDFALIKNGEDTEVHFQSKSRYKSKSESDDWQCFRALLTAFGFTHGVQPWPYRIEYWRDGKKIADHFTAPRKLERTPHASFPGGFGLGPQTKRKGTRNSVIRLAARFFDQHSTLSEQLKNVLFLFRAAGSDSVNLHIETLALCSLFEGVVDLLFAELKLEERLFTQEPHFSEYLKLREELLLILQKKAAKGDAAAKRLAGSLGHAQALRLRDKFAALCSHFSLPYETEMKQHFDAWHQERNPLLHGRWDFHDTDFANQSLIAGAINVLIVKLIGYSGSMRVNIFGDSPSERYRRI